MSGRPGEAVRELRVWACPVGTTGATAAAELSAAEQERAARFRFDDDRARYIASHVWLRRVLASCTGVPARTLDFAIGPHGKPSLVGSAAAVHFNLTHSGDLALIVTSAAAAVGIDVERARPMPDADAVAERILVAAELAIYTGLPAADRVDFLLSVWTRKEACLKGMGTGLSLDPRAIEPTVAEPGVWRVIGPDREAWTVYDLDILPGYHAAVTAPGSGWSVVRCDPDSLVEP